MNNPYGFLLGENCPFTLIEAQERACEIEEHLISSYPQNMNGPEETAQIDEVVNFIETMSLFETYHIKKTYLQMVEGKATTKFVDHMINFIKSENTPNLDLKELSHPTKGDLSIMKERLNFKKTIAVNEDRDKMLQYVREFSSEFHKWEESVAINFSQGETVTRNGSFLKELQKENDISIIIQIWQYDEKI